MQLEQLYSVLPAGRQFTPGSTALLKCALSMATNRYVVIQSAWASSQLCLTEVQIYGGKNATTTACNYARRIPLVGQFVDCFILYIVENKVVKTIEIAATCARKKLESI